MMAGSSSQGSKPKAARYAASFSAYRALLASFSASVSTFGSVPRW